MDKNSEKKICFYCPIPIVVSLLFLRILRASLIFAVGQTTHRFNKDIIKNIALK